MARAAGCDAEHQARCAQYPTVYHRFGQPVDGVASVVLRDRQDLSRALRSLDHSVAGPDRQAHWLLDRDVLAGVERLQGQRVVMAGVRHDVHGVQVFLGLQQRFEAGVDPRPPAQALLCHGGHVLGRRGVDVANGHELERVGDPLQLYLAVDVAQAHCAAPDLGYVQSGYVTPPAVRIETCRV